MSKLKGLMFKRAILASLILLLAIIPYLQLRNDVQAAALVTLSDTLTRLDNSVVSSHDILFTLPAAETFDATQTITYDFDEDAGTPKWAVDGAGTVVGDLDFNDGTERTVVDVDGDCTGHAGADDVVIGINDATGVVTVTACGSMTSSGAAATVNLEYGTAAGGTNRVTNPAATGSTVLAIDHASGTNTGSLAVPIMTDDQVTVSATVDPSITSALSATTCTLGTLVTSAINTCNYTNTVTTNAGSGYSSTIVEDGDLRTAGADTIDDETGDSDVDQGTEEYGVSSNDTTGAQDIVDTDGSGCDGTDPEAASAITGTAQEYADNTGAVSSEVTTLCHAASIIGTTPAGSYSHIVTHITTGTF
jgi:hypothetical protein